MVQTDIHSRDHLTEAQEHLKESRSEPHWSLKVLQQNGSMLYQSDEQHRHNTKNVNRKEWSVTGGGRKRAAGTDQDKMYHTVRTLHPATPALSVGMDMIQGGNRLCLHAHPGTAQGDLQCTHRGMTGICGGVGVITTLPTETGREVAARETSETEMVGMVGTIGRGEMA
jgi:hypothetical protein